VNEWLQIGLYSAVGCVFMAIQDVGYTLNARAVATSKSWLAGWMNGLVDLSAFAILSFSGVNLTTKYGWRGWIGTIPVIVVAVLVTKFATDKADLLEDEDENREDRIQDGRIQALEVKLQSLQRRLEASEKAANAKHD
jgi:hypothetical protein